MKIFRRRKVQLEKVPNSKVFFRPYPQKSQGWGVTKRKRVLRYWNRRLSYRFRGSRSSNTTKNLKTATKSWPWDEWWKFSGGGKCKLKNGQSLGFFSLGGSKISGLRSYELKIGRSVLKFSVDHFVKLMFGLKTTEFLKTWRKSSTKVLQIFVKLIHLVAFLK